MNDVADFAIAVVWQSGIVAGAALVALRAMRRASGRARHAFAVFALVVSAIVPWVRFAPSGTATGQAGLPVLHEDVVAQVIAIIYMLLVGHAVVALVRAWWHAHRLRRNPGEVTSPATVGVFRPVIVLPASLPPGALMPVLAHELAHVRRRDVLVQWLIELVTLPVAFHPLVRLLKRHAAVAREIACDEAVTPAIVDPRRYAQMLLTLAAPAPHGGLAFGDVEALEMRLVSLRDGRRPMRAALIAVTVAIIVIGGGAALFRVDLFRPNFSGRWRLDGRATSFGPVPRYDDSFVTLRHDGNVLTSDQTRVRGNRRQRVRWRVEIGSKGAWWEGDALVLEMSKRGHWERTRASLADRNTLVCEGEVRERKGGGHFRFVFRRQS